MQDETLFHKKAETALMKSKRKSGDEGGERSQSSTPSTQDSGNVRNFDALFQTLSSKSVKICFLCIHEIFFVVFFFDQFQNGVDVSERVSETEDHVSKLYCKPDQFLNKY